MKKRRFLCVTLALFTVFSMLFGCERQNEEENLIGKEKIPYESGWESTSGENTDAGTTGDTVTDTDTDTEPSPETESAPETLTEIANSISPEGGEMPLPTEAEWKALGLTRWEGYNMVCALLSDDVDAFARHCGVAAKVYDSMRGMKIASYRIYRETIPAVDNPSVTRPYPVLELEITESQNEFFAPGTRRIVLLSGMVDSFADRDTYQWTSIYSDPRSAAVRYVNAVGSDRDFSSISAEAMRQFGLADFIVGRLNTLYGNHDPRTAEEIRAYAEKYLDVDGDTLYLDGLLDQVEGGYIRIGRGSSSPSHTVVSEEIRDGITVVTVQFWADFAQTVPSRLVEFHLQLLDVEYKPIKTVILEDSDFRTASYST